ncbi:MAG: response regulator transcription factor [Massilia sp.]
MNVIILSPVRLLGDSLAACLQKMDDVAVSTVVDRLSALREALARAPADIALIDVSQQIALDEVRSVAVDWPATALVAVGLNEQRHEVTRCGHAGFVGYVSREGSFDELRRVLTDVAAGRLACSAEVSGELIRALFRMAAPAANPLADEALTRREEEVLRLIGAGLSNKEIARELNLSVATVKQHVHHVLAKLHLPDRVQAMRRWRDEPWMAPERKAG